MADKFSSKKRSEIMGRIGGKDTKPELAVRSLLHRAGYRFSLHKKDLPGKPDICLPKYKAVVFVHGCYWHRHTGCNRGKSMPTSNIDFWLKKFEGTKIRDKRVLKELQSMGWKTIVVWQCELSKPEKLLQKLRKKLSAAV